ncbi:MAG: leucyl aminopeptidase [Fretibacterium sp.]|nr:leucyl aminopeptidase [Fretibacterium sp.]
MEIQAYNGSMGEWRGDAVLLLLREEDCLTLPSLPGAEAVRLLAERKDFSGKKGSSLRLPLLEGGIKNLYLMGLGKAEACSTAGVRDTLAWGLRMAGRQRNESVLVPLSHLEDAFKDGDPSPSAILGEAAGLCGYVFDKYKEKKEGEYEPFALKEVFVPGLVPEKARQGQIFAAAQVAARALANEPGCAISPAGLAENAAAMAGELGLDCEVWDEKRLEQEGMGALLAVGSGSANPPRLIHLTYKPEGTAKRKIVLVGKGITFDSGGLDIKPSNFMTTMKGDKSGACAVLGVLRGAAELGLDTEVHGLLAAAENMPSGSSYRPDDIVRARNGKTIEIDNTDAEGRLVLADALCLASELKPDAIIDMATLTGACAVALGKWRAGLFTRDNALADALLASSLRRGEPFWRMPAEDEHIEESLKSPFADMVNSGPRYGGAIFATIFLSRFVEKSIPWAHLDIAGVDFMDKEWGVYSRGASGFGVRTCLDYLTR